MAGLSVLLNPTATVQGWVDAAETHDVCNTQRLCRQDRHTDHLLCKAAQSPLAGQVFVRFSQSQLERKRSDREVVLRDTSEANRSCDPSCRFHCESLRLSVSRRRVTAHLEPCQPGQIL